MEELTEIEYGNCVIAKFMGGRIANPYNPNGYPHYGAWTGMEVSGIQQKLGMTVGIHIPICGLRFYESWDWLMLAVQKIEDDSYSVLIKDGYCEIQGQKHTGEWGHIFSREGITKIDAVWKCLVDFIQVVMKVRV